MSDELHLHPLHERLIQVETALAFQQQLVDELNAAVLEQSRSLQQLEKQVRLLQEQSNQGKANDSSLSDNETGEVPDQSE
jgi:uncharacterized coiled-coil protein SlyX